REVDEDGLARHGGVEVVVGSWCSGIRPAVGLTRTHRGDGALVGDGRADFVDDHGVTTGLELVYRLIDGRWAGRNGDGGGRQCQPGRRQHAGGDGGDDELVHGVPRWSGCVDPGDGCVTG